MRPDILLITGKYFDYTHPDAQTQGLGFGLRAIAQGVSHECRFAGQCDVFYSVAQHLVEASYRADPGFEFELLMHDASEAFCKDIPKPMKQLLPDYGMIEANVERAIGAKFNLYACAPEAGAIYEITRREVKRVDRLMLNIEQKNFMGGRWHSNWEGCDPSETEGQKLYAWPAKYARYRFIKRFMELTCGAPGLKNRLHIAAHCLAPRLVSYPAWLERRYG